MKSKHLFQTFLATCALTACLTSFAVSPEKFTNEQLGEIWSQLWNVAKEPTLDPLSEKDVIDNMLGSWTATYGTMPDTVTISISTNHQVQVSGHKDGTDWKKTGQWRVVSNKLVLYLDEDSTPSYVFRVKAQYFVFDPWAKTMMSKLTQEKAPKSTKQPPKN